VPRKKKGDTESLPVFPEGSEGGGTGGLPDIPDHGSSIADPLPLELFQDSAPPEPPEVAAAAPRHVLFGEIAVQEKYVTPAQLDECLEVLRTTTPPPRLGRVMQDKGYLTQLQLEVILDIQRVNLADRRQKRETGRLFGQLAAAAGFCTSEQVREALLAQLEGGRKGARRLIGQILLSAGRINHFQFFDILRRQDKYFVHCDGCAANYLVEGKSDSNRVLCRGCFKVLTLPLQGNPAVQSSAWILREEQEHPPKRLSARGAEALGPFTFMSEVGRGTHGVVLLVKDQRISKVRALKLFRLPEGVAREGLARAMQPVLRLKHPSVIEVHESGVIEGLPYLSMSFITGTTLALMISKQALELDSQVLVLEKVARTLADTHQRAIPHGNLKPTNILLDENGNPHLTDFGLGAIEGVPQAGDVISDVEYRAPEQGRGSGSAAGDVYSVGVLLFKALTSRTPQSVAETGGELPRVPSAINPSAPADLEAICLKCLREHPEERYANMTLVADDLRRWLKGEPVQARRSQPTSMLVSPRKKSRRRALVAAAIILAAVVVGFLLLK
jgi:tRNA A-37 threonylcarbamoyl transferase component Bud32